jgi:hypothetical protein
MRESRGRDGQVGQRAHHDSSGGGLLRERDRIAVRIGLVDRREVIGGERVDERARDLRADEDAEEIGRALVLRRVREVLRVRRDRLEHDDVREPREIGAEAERELARRREVPSVASERDRSVRLGSGATCENSTAIGRAAARVDDLAASGPWVAAAPP